MATSVETQDDLGQLRLLARAQRGIEPYGWRACLREAALRPLRPALAPVAAQRLRRRATHVDGVDSVLNLAFDFDAFGINVRPGQVRLEFERLLQQVAECPPRAVLEIGTANGGSLFSFAGLCAPTAHIISVDLPQGQFGGGYPSWKIPLYKAFAGPNQRLDLIRGDSHATSTLERVQDLLGGAVLDLLFIDGDHTYEGVRQDFEDYSPLVRPGGLIAFHDIAWPDEEAIAGSEVEYLVGEVPRFWSELRAKHGGEEYIYGTGFGFGIGLIRAPR